jgi:hypothetical protein
MNPLVHYLRYGHREDRSPQAGFDSEFYRRARGDNLAAQQDPLSDYVLSGAPADRRLSPLFDRDFDRAEVGRLGECLDAGLPTPRSRTSWRSCNGSTSTAFTSITCRRTRII